VPIVVVQHMPPMFTKILAERLDKKSALAVCEGADGARIAPGIVTIAPGDRHMELASRERNRVYDGPHENTCRTSDDPLFRTAAARYGDGVLAILLTGMGRDGLRGAEEVALAGGHILVQDEATSVVWGMPGFIARAGLADAALPLPAMAAEIVRRVAVGRDAAVEVAS
jgi:two-component system chemotaxis response regulator CheB